MCHLYQDHIEGKCSSGLKSLRHLCSSVDIFAAQASEHDVVSVSWCCVRSVDWPFQSTFRGYCGTPALIWPIWLIRLDLVALPDSRY